MFIECLFSSVCALVFIAHFHETSVKASSSLKLFQAQHPWGEMERLQRSRDWCWRPNECHCDRQEDIVDLGMLWWFILSVNRWNSLWETRPCLWGISRDGTEEKRPTLDVGSALPQAVVTHQIKMEREGCKLRTNIHICFLTAGAGRCDLPQWTRLPQGLGQSNTHPFISCFFLGVWPESWEE